MSLTFGGAISDRVDVTAAASINNLDPYTVLMWVNPTTLTTNNILHNKNTQKQFIVAVTTSEIRVNIARATTNTNYISNAGIIVTGAWQMVGYTFNTAASAGEVVNLYKGDLTTAAAETTYTANTDGSGAVTSDSGGAFVIGNRPAADRAWQGQIACLAVFNRVLSLGEIIDWQFTRRRLSGCVLYQELGYNGVSTQPDWSGSANSGAVTGATQSSHVPLRAPFRQRIQYVPVVTGGGGGATVLPDVGVLTLTGFAPTIVTPQTVLPGVGVATLAGFAPTIVTPQAAAAGVGVLTLAGFAPTVQTSAGAAPGVGALTLTGFAPTILTPVAVLPGVGVLTLTGAAATILTPRVVLPGVGVLDATGLAPSALTPRVVLPGLGSATLAGLAPTIVTPLLISTGVGALVLDGFTPTASATLASYIIAGPLAMIAARAELHDAARSTTLTNPNARALSTDRSTTPQLHAVTTDD